MLLGPPDVPVRGGDDRLVLPTSGTPITVRIGDGEILDLTAATAVVLINHPFDRITTPSSQGDVSPALACIDPAPWGQLLPVAAIVAVSAHPFVCVSGASPTTTRQEALFKALIAAMAQ